MSTKTKRTQFDICKFCRVAFDPNAEGVTYSDGSSAHEECHDSQQFRDANESDSRD